ncbi:MAG: NAD(P)H:quinone oxidoreductase [Gammaproteobacteria bacterium]|nr:NAD(P)H:quinone oxidoreductase [Gammaproteobacteria bacterium]
MSTPYVLVLYYSVHGSTKALAEKIAQGVEAGGLEARLRTVPAVSSNHEATAPAVPDSGAPYCTANDLTHCAGLAMGSPTRFGNMAAPMKYFLDNSIEQWVNGSLINKPAGVFTASATLHGGQESTLLSMMIPLLHHGMVLAGCPYSESVLNTTQSGGTPYGPSHVTFSNDHQPLSADEITLAIAFGKRLAKLAKQLQS